MNTLFLLMAQFDGRPVVPADEVCRAFFAPLTTPVFLRKVGSGEINLPLLRMEKSQKGAKMVDLRDLAAFLDERREAATREARALRA